MLPIRLVKFWYVDSLNLFFRVWVHLISFLEEDLAVSLMFKLLFVPLFHDSSLVGRVLSFGFRLFRVVFGLVAYILASLALLLITLVWFGLPMMAFVPSVRYFAWTGILFGLALFIDQILFYPAKTLWHTKTFKDAWKVTKLKKSQISWEKLLNSFEVKQILDSLELNGKTLLAQNLKLTDAVIEGAFKLAKDSNAKYLTEGYFWLVMLEQIPGIENELFKYSLGI